MISQLDLSGNVDRGVQFLNKLVPGWHWKVNLSTLNMASLYGKCLLSQVYGGVPFDQAVFNVQTISADLDTPRMGFCFPLLEGVTQGFRELDRLWTNRVLQIRAYELWERDGRQEGQSEKYWFAALHPEHARQS